MSYDDNRSEVRRSDALTEYEIKNIRKLLDQDAKTRWFWTTLRTWFIWGGAVATAISVMYSSLAETLKHLVSK